MSSTHSNIKMIIDPLFVWMVDNMMQQQDGEYGSVADCFRYEEQWMMSAGLSSTFRRNVELQLYNI
jgi:hypothetical protein